MRRTVALTALLAALAAAKPLPPRDPAGSGAADPARESWRGEAIAACVGELRSVDGLSPDDLESICGCAASNALEADGVPPPLPGGHLSGRMRSLAAMCTARVRPDREGDVARLAVSAPEPPPTTTTALPPTTDKPVDDDATPAESDGGNAGGFGAWLRALSLPAWLTGASALLWVALGIFVFGLLVLKLRRRDPRKDLMGPPASMRRGAAPQPPRRPDLPR